MALKLSLIVSLMKNPKLKNAHICVAKNFIVKGNTANPSLNQ